MQLHRRTTSLYAALLLGACSPSSEDTGTSTSAAASDHDPNVVHAQVVATGIPGAGAICQIGAFHRSSPIHDKPAFIPFTQPGHVLNGARLLVASTSNFGAPLGNPGEYAGTVLSIDPSSPSAVPPGFAAAGDQASALGGAVQVYASNNAAFLNSRFEPQAVTAAEVSAGLPLGISINSGNGRPW